MKNQTIPAKNLKGDQPFTALHSGDAAEAGELAVDVFQTETEIVVIAPIAGVKRENLNIQVIDGVLKISGSRPFRFEITESAYVTKECFWGPFQRSIILPDYTDAAGITAAFKDAILSIRIPKVEPVRTRTIEIEI